MGSLSHPGLTISNGWLVRRNDSTSLLSHSVRRHLSVSKAVTIHQLHTGASRYLGARPQRNHLSPTDGITAWAHKQAPG